MVAEFEADLIRSRTKEGMRVAKAKGHLRGKQPKLNPRQEVHLVALLRTGEYTIGDLGDLFGVGRSTVYRALARSRNAALGAGTVATAVAARSTPAVPPHDDPDTVTPTYPPRHGAPSDVPSQTAASPRARAARPERAPHTAQ